MKYKIVGAIGCAVILLLSVVNWSYVFSADIEKTRYEQHKEATPKPDCTDHGDDVFCTHLPLISIDTGGVTIPGRPYYDDPDIKYTLAEDGSDRISAYMRVMDSTDENNHLNDTATLESNIKIHIRGHSSRHFDKAGYKVNLYTEDGDNNPLALLGMDAHHSWAMHGPYLDKTLIRNYMWYNISGSLMGYAPNVRFFELFIDGEYQGVYLLVETIDSGDNGARLGLEVNAKRGTYTGYLLHLDRNNTVEYNRLNSFSSYMEKYDEELKLEVEVPSKNKLTPEMLKSIKDDFSAFEKAIYSFDLYDEKYGYERYIDVDSFILYFLINEITMNYDAGTFSTYIYKDTSGKFKFCVWDFNNACDNYQEQGFINDQKFELQNRLWMQAMFQDDAFVERVIKRYKELRYTYFSEEYLMNYIDDTIAYLGDAVDRNFEVWGYSFDNEKLLTPSYRNLHSYDEAVDQLKNFLHVRMAWMDENIESLRQNCAKSKVKISKRVSE